VIRPAQPDVEELSLTAVLHALSDPTRLELVRLMSDGAEHPCSGLYGLGGLSVPTLSHHLRVLREAGITNTRIEGKQRFIALRGADLQTRFPGLIAAVVDAAPTA
jgi:DNA-binding transcriptional ArsR family regulator